MIRKHSPTIPLPAVVERPAGWRPSPYPRGPQIVRGGLGGRGGRTVTDPPTVALRASGPPARAVPAGSVRTPDPVALVRWGVTVVGSTGQALFLGYTVGLFPVGLPWAVINGMAIAGLVHLFTVDHLGRSPRPEREVPDQCPSS